MNISILILTLNEEVNLPACLESVKWSDDIVVLDSYSSDRTCTVAKQFGARVIMRRFDNWSSHYNWALDNISFRHGWVLNLDADERMTESLRDELFAIAARKEPKEVAYYCGRKNYFMGKWIRHAMAPGFVMRFFKPEFVRFERLVHPVALVKGKCGKLQNYIEHYNFSKGFSDWFDKHNKYSAFEAIEERESIKEPFVDLRNIFSLDSIARRKALKHCAVRLPFRPFLKFIYLYFVNLGFMDGRRGLRYCILQSIYEYMIVLKSEELQGQDRQIQPKADFVLPHTF